MTFVTVGELTRWARLRSWGPRSRAEVSLWLRGAATVRWDRTAACAMCLVRPT